ncbi:MAG TPA: RteC domain-containing protein [Chitinophagaceae bacterium]|nr:RteC domain-containing protein [Chitinophagaceae bacterium]
MIPAANQLYAELQKDLALVGDRFLSLEQIEERFNICNDAVMALHDLTKEKGFADRQEEILFFKKIKPRFTSLLRYYILLYNHHLFKPADSDECVQYLERSLHVLNRPHADPKWYLNEPDPDHSDERYFTRKDENCITTSGEILISDRIARELLAEYIKNELEGMQSQNDQTN